MINAETLLGREVAIVGGGAGGLATALALASRGIRSQVFERSSQDSEIDRGDIIHFSSQRILRRWGAWPQVEHFSPRSFTGFHVLDGDGRSLLELDTANLLGAGVELTALRHAHIVTALRKAAVDTGLVQVTTSEPVTELTTDGERVTGVRTERCDYPAALTVLATGSRCKLRDRHFGKAAVRDYDRSFFNVRVKAIDGFGDGGYYVLDRHGILVMVRLPGDQLRIGAQFVTSERTNRPHKHNFGEWVGSVFRPLAGDQLTVIDGHAYRLQGVFADRWSVPGAVLLGDAAHTVHPTGGQGMNLAFGDAEALADCLQDVPSMAALDSAGERYAATRRRQVRPVFRRAHLGGLMAGLTHPRAVSGRAAAVRLVNFVAPVKRGLFRRVVDVR
jgi:2-polyprenyl-6-methoxyphenol hydroxylase-like FAD-dependent oxidoreductase